MALTNGALIADRYRLIRLIATGGMGQVWEADDNRLGRRVAVKVLKAEFSSDPEFLERFRLEARTTAKLNHPGIAGVYDYGEMRDASGDSTAYLVMELVNGEPLNAVLARVGRLAPAYALDMLEQTGRALQVAHSAGVVHRDVKPGNILITPTGQVKITDFGIAKAIESSPVTRTGMVMGTAQYIAPEQALGQDANAASDVYSLGIVGYEALSGQRPFLGEGALTVAMKHVREAAPPLPDDLPPHIRELIEITIAKDPLSRYRDGSEFAEAVSAVRAGRRPPIPGSAGEMTARVVPPPPVTGMTQMIPSSQAVYAVPPPADFTDDEPREGMGNGQKAVIWAAVGLLVLAVLVAGGTMLLNSNTGREQPTRPPVTPVLPTLTSVLPPPTTTTVPLPPPVITTTTTPPVTTTTTPPVTTTTTTTTKTTTTTTEPTTTTTTTSEEPTTTTEQGQP